ncbi:MAG: glycosyltransferase family 4 protein [Acidobacteriaceae bacterium]|nr:glycosyltransferase family 4 protein [Acidobacteriaceae bacterium]
MSEARGLPIEFTGWQSDVKTIYSQLDILVVPSQSHEATTRVIPEAYSAGVPVVAFPSGGIPEIVQDGRTGFLCSDTTAKALAQRISEVLTMERSEIDSIVRTAQAEWERRFTLDKYKDQVCRVITSAVPGSV